MMSETHVAYRKDGSVGVIELARPEKLNALIPEMLVALEDIADEIDRDTDIRAVVLTGQGNAFCVGADINVWSSLQPLDMWRRWVRDGHRILDRLAALRQPVVSAVNGPAFGGGLELLAATDIRVASDDAVFALPEASIATCPGWSGTQRLARQLGPCHVKYMALTGRRMSATEALDIGLVQKLASKEQVFPEAMEVARQICSLAPVSVQLTKQLIDAAWGEKTASTLEAMAGALAATTNDAAEGLASFRGKRKAQYEGD
ncbi:MAG: enoyl-CoA hydratase/isomerase family protein [Rhodocyclaceae bacterium]